MSIIKIHQIIGLLFLCLFSAYWYGITCFPHSHVENGVVIVHSLPFHEDNHTDTDVQYETIFCLTHFFSVECSAFHFDSIVRYAHLLTTLFVWHCPAVQLGKQSALYLRSPPL